MNVSTNGLEEMCRHHIFLLTLHYEILSTTNNPRLLPVFLSRVRAAHHHSLTGTLLADTLDILFLPRMRVPLPMLFHHKTS